MKDIMKALCEKFDLDQNKVSSLTVTFEAEPFGAGITMAKVELIHLEDVDVKSEELKDAPEESESAREQYNKGAITFNEFRRLANKTNLRTVE